MEKEHYITKSQREVHHPSSLKADLFPCCSHCFYCPSPMYVINISMFNAPFYFVCPLAEYLLIESITVLLNAFYFISLLRHILSPFSAPHISFPCHPQPWIIGCGMTHMLLSPEALLRTQAFIKALRSLVCRYRQWPGIYIS